MRRLLLFIVLLPLAAWPIDVPRVGYARDSQGLVRPLDGVSGNFLIGDPLADDPAVAFAWNGTLGIRKTDASLEWWDSAGVRVASVDAPAGDVVIGFDRAGSSAWVFSKSDQTLSEVALSQWRMGVRTVPASLANAEEEVLAVAGGRDSVDVAVRRAEGIFVVTFDRVSGSRISEVAVTRGASRVLLLGDGSIAGIDESTVWLRRVDGSEWSVDTGVALADLSPMGRDWIQAGTFALRVGGASEPRLYQIPEAVQ